MNADHNLKRLVQTPEEFRRFKVGDRVTLLSQAVEAHVDYGYVIGSSGRIVREASGRFDWTVAFDWKLTSAPGGETRTLHGYWEYYVNEIHLAPDLTEDEAIASIRATLRRGHRL